MICWGRHFLNDLFYFIAHFRNARFNSPAMDNSSKRIVLRWQIYSDITSPLTNPKEQRILIKFAFSYYAEMSKFLWWKSFNEPRGKHKTPISRWWITSSSLAEKWRRKKKVLKKSSQTIAMFAQCCVVRLLLKNDYLI